MSTVLDTFQAKREGAIEWSLLADMLNMHSR